MLDVAVKMFASITFTILYHPINVVLETIISICNDHCSLLSVKRGCNNYYYCLDKHFSSVVVIFQVPATDNVT